MTKIRNNSKQFALLHNLASWYRTYIFKNMAIADADFILRFKKAKTDNDKATILLYENLPMPKGCHQWYLKCFRIKSGKSAVCTIESKRLWLIPKTITDFEQLYEYVAKNLCGIPYIGQMTFYDIALRIAIINNNPSLFPQKSVYLHALSFLALRMLIRKGYISRIPLSKTINNVSTFGMLTQLSLDARMIEDLFCYVYKSRKRVERGQLASSPKDVDLDKIVKLL